MSCAEEPHPIDSNPNCVHSYYSFLSPLYKVYFNCNNVINIKNNYWRNNFYENVLGILC